MQTNKLLGSILLIAGTSMGAAMLALPVSTAAYGFLPATLAFILCWMFMTATAFLMLEVNLWLKPGANIVSMATYTLGIPGKLVAWISYALLFYSLMAAYVSGMGDLVQTGIKGLFDIHIFNGSGALLMVLLVGSAVFIGAQSVDYLNRFFFIGKILTYFVVIFFLFSHIKLPHLTEVHFNKVWIALPIIVTSFGFHNMIPSLRVYLNDDIKKLRLALLAGSIIPLFVYILWEIVILGVLPKDGTDGLMSILASGQPGSGLPMALDHVLNSGVISVLFKAFTIFAISTSFIGVSFSLFDFVIDSCNIKRDYKGKILATILTFLPPLIFAYAYPNGFMVALGYAGIFVGILLGLMPTLMSWSGRHWKNVATGYRPRINRFAMVLLLLFSIVIMLK